MSRLKVGDTDEEGWTCVFAELGPVDGSWWATTVHPDGLPVDTQTYLYPPGSDDGIELPLPMDWTVEDAPHPVGCQVRAGDVLPPVASARDRANPSSVAEVSAVYWDPGAEKVVIVIRDDRPRPRWFRVGALERVRLGVRTRRYVPRTATAAVEDYDGPFTNSRGALFVFMLRPSSGGRWPAATPRFSDEREPMYSEDRTEVLPYVVAPPAGSDDGPGPVRVGTDVLGPQARLTPAVKKLLAQ